MTDRRLEDYVYPTSAAVAQYDSALDSLAVAADRARRYAAAADAGEFAERIEAFQGELHAAQRHASILCAEQERLEGRFIEDEY